MNRIGVFIFWLGVLFATAWWKLIFEPYQDPVLGKVTPFQDEDSNQLLPPEINGLALIGSEAYGRHGCVHCHTQQVRGVNQSSDVARGWGKRRTVARDYLNEPVAYLGYQRIGQDLSNVGLNEEYTEKWHHQHLYAPRSVVEWSTMPSYKFLYQKRKIQGAASPEALEVEDVEEGYEIVPKPEAKALVAYLMSLKKDYGLPEQPIQVEEE